MMQLPSHIQEVMDKATCLFQKEQVEQALDEMAAEITELLSTSNPIFLCVMIGGLIPAGNLLPRLDFPLAVDYIHATRYQGNTKGGAIYWRSEPKFSMKDRTVLILDDILDHGKTLKAVVDYCKGQQAKAVYTAVLVDKEFPRDEEGIQKADFTGLQVGNRYVFGYGMDYQEYLRNAPGIYMVSPEHE